MATDAPSNCYAARVRELGGRFLDGTPLQVTQEDFAYLEQQIGVMLPDDFKEFMRDYGLYLFSYQAHFPFDSTESVEGDLGIILSAKPIPRVYIFDFYKELSKDQCWPRWLLPFAHNGGDNYLAIALTSGKCGAIYFYASAGETLLYVADSFDQFFNSIYLVDDDLVAEDDIYVIED